MPNVDDSDVDRAVRRLEERGQMCELLFLLRGMDGDRREAMVAVREELRGKQCSCLLSGKVQYRG